MKDWVVCGIVWCINDGEEEKVNFGWNLFIVCLGFNIIYLYGYK